MYAFTHNDSPTDTDAFQQTDFIDGIARVIQNCTPPKGIAINGYWGTGKTSALRQLQKKLTTQNGHDNAPEETTVVPVWFEA